MSELDANKGTVLDKDASCRRCYGPIGDKPIGPLCFDCGMLGRPFYRYAVCNGCRQGKPIVRLYLEGWRCDACRPRT